MLKVLGLAEGPIAALAHGHSTFGSGLPARQLVHGEILRVGARVADITLIKQVRLRCQVGLQTAQVLQVMLEVLR